MVHLESQSNGYLLVGSVDILDSQDGEVVVVAGVAEGNSGTGLDGKGVDLLLVDVEGDGHAEKQTAGETVILDDTVDVIVSSVDN